MTNAAPLFVSAVALLLALLAPAAAQQTPPGPGPGETRPGAPAPPRRPQEGEPRRPPAPAPTPAPTPGRPKPPEGPPELEPPGPSVALALKEAILRALENNADLDIQRIEIAIARAGIDAARGAFDPVVFADGSWGKNRDPFFSRNPFGSGVNPVTGLPGGLQVNQSDVASYDAGFRQTTWLGTGWELRYDNFRRTTENEFALDPSWTPALTATITQPLLRGLGIDVNRAFVTIARENTRISQENFRDVAMTLAFSVEEAYWNYVFAVENRKVAEQALKTAEDLLEVNRRKLEFGRLAPIEVLVAETGVAARHEAVIVSRAEVLNARDRLFRLIEPHGSTERWNVTLVPVDAPRVDEEKIDVEAAYRIALERRPDLAALVRQIEADRVRLRRAENDELPKLDLVGTWSQLGLGDSHHNSHAALFDGRYYDFSVGIAFEYPLFNQAAEGATEQAALAVRRGRKQLESLEQQIVLDVRTAARDVAAARERIRAADKAADLAGRQLEEEKKRLELGLSTNHDVLVFEQDLTQARTNALRARTDYEVARARLARVTGTTLERRAIHVRER